MLAPLCLKPLNKGASRPPGCWRDSSLATHVPLPGSPTLPLLTYPGLPGYRLNPSSTVDALSDSTVCDRTGESSGEENAFQRLKGLREWKPAGPGI